MCYLPLLSLIVLMDYFRALYSTALQSIIFGTCVCWNGLLRFTRPWSSLGLSWLVGAEVPDVTEFWFYSLQFGTSELCRFILWKLVPCVYGLVFTQRRPLGGAGLFLKISTLAPLTWICFPIWVRILCLRPLLCHLYHLNYLSTSTLFDWSTRMVYSLLMVYVNLVDFHIWYSATLIQFTWRLLFAWYFWH
uniref:Uncharacterized protein n=1 Tax=Opuntia streptacantha TaxID=393608 RepID=A0A7C8ZT14_OPUST